MRMRTAKSAVLIVGADKKSETSCWRKAETLMHKGYEVIIRFVKNHRNFITCIFLTNPAPMGV